MSKDKILVVSNMYPDKKHLNYGVFVKNFCKQLKKCEVPYELVALTKQDSKIGKILHYGKFILKTILKCLFSDYKYIYVHYLSVSSIPVIMAAKFKKLHIIANAHGTDVMPESEKQEACQVNTRKILALAEKIVVPSEYFKDCIEEKYADLVKGKPIIVYPSGGVDDDIFYCMEDTLPIYKKHGFNMSNIYMGYCGRISKTKGIDTLLEAVRIVSSRRDNFRLIIVGSGDYEQETEEKIKELGLSDIVIRYPMMTQKELCEIYNVIEAFLFPTEGESLGLVAVEAMACGTPVIASDCTAPRYYVKDKVNGFKFQMGNAKEMADKIELFCENYLQDDTLIQGAKKTAAAYKAAKTRPKLLKILE